MTNIKRDATARKRGKLNRESVGRRRSPTIDARRRLNDPRPGTPLRANQVGGGDPRYAYLADPHD